MADVSDIFYFFCLGREKGVGGRSEGGGVSIFIENPRRGGSPEGGGAEGPGGCLRRIGDLGGGGAKYFFSGPKSPPRLMLP